MFGWIRQLWRKRLPRDFGNESRGYYHRQMALNKLIGSRNLRWVEPLLRAISTGGPAARKDAALALGELGDRRAVEALVAALADPIQEVRTTASEALGKLGDRQVVQPLVTVLSKALVERGWGLDGRAAVTALGNLGDRRAVEPLIGCLDHGLFLIDATRALGQLGDRRAVAPLIRELNWGGLSMTRLGGSGKPLPPWSGWESRSGVSTWPIRLAVREPSLGGWRPSTTRGRSSH